MSRVTIKEEGVLQLPPEISGRLNVKPSDTILIEMDERGALHLYPQKVRIEDVCGMLNPPNHTCPK